MLVRPTPSTTFVLGRLILGWRTLWAFSTRELLKALQQCDIEGRLRAMEAVVATDKPPRKR